MTARELIELLQATPADAMVVLGDVHDGGFGVLRSENVKLLKLGAEDNRGMWLVEPWREGLDGPFAGVHISVDAEPPHDMERVAEPETPRARGTNDVGTWIGLGTATSFAFGFALAMLLASLHGGSPLEVLTLGLCGIVFAAIFAAIAVRWLRVCARRTTPSEAAPCDPFERDLARARLGGNQSSKYFEEKCQSEAGFINEPEPAWSEGEPEQVRNPWHVLVHGTWLERLVRRRVSKEQMHISVDVQLSREIERVAEPAAPRGIDKVGTWIVLGTATSFTFGITLAMLLVSHSGGALFEVLSLGLCGVAFAAVFAAVAVRWSRSGSRHPELQFRRDFARIHWPIWAWLARRKERDVPSDADFGRFDPPPARSDSDPKRPITDDVQRDD